MKIVSLEWFTQSLERGMVLEEGLFHPTLPIEQQGIGAWDRSQPMSPTLGKRTRGEEGSLALNPFRRKLRRSASTKMGTQSDALWAGITAASTDVQHNDEDDWTDSSIVIKKNDMQRNSPAARPRPLETPTIDEETSTYSDPVAVRKRAPEPAAGNMNGGIFQGRVICPYGFDGKKVCTIHSVLGFD